MRLAACLVALSALAACGPPPAPAPVPAPAPPGAACVGQVEAVGGLQEVQDEALLARALGAPGKGMLCKGKVFAAVEAVTVYRVWDSSKAYTQLGSWWSFARPLGPREAYQAANAICPAWSKLDVSSTCRLKVGARVVVGPGQSADCSDEATKKKWTVPASATNQVFIPNETRDPANQQVFVEGCSPGAPWP